jgi:SAM-dependent methyltransferase
MSIVRSAINVQVRLSKWLDSYLPAKYTRDGNFDFLRDFAPRYLAPNLVAYDVGSGKQPYIDIETKKKLELKVVGLDIDQSELDKAPIGAYDQTVCADITLYSGHHDADIIICQALLEHVQNVPLAFKAISSILKPGGKVLIFVPSRNAVFARLNLFLPDRLKKWVLFTIFPHTRAAQGFHTFYNRCTPRDFLALAQQNSLELVEQRLFFKSGYFSFFFPLYFVWRLWVLLFHALAGDQAAETFSMCLKKTAAVDSTVVPVVPHS